MLLSQLFHLSTQKVHWLEICWALNELLWSKSSYFETLFPLLSDIFSKRFCFSMGPGMILTDLFSAAG
jgi:hypothetical protein